MRKTPLLVWVAFFAPSAVPAAAQQTVPEALLLQPAVERSTSGAAYLASPSAPVDAGPKIGPSHMRDVLAGIEDVNFDNAANLGSRPSETPRQGFGAWKPSGLGTPIELGAAPAKKERALDATMLLSPACGVIITRLAYAGQNDKYLHAYAGAGISIVSTLAGSWVVGKTDYSLKTKKVLLKLLGPAAGMAAGLVKEYVYDHAHRDRHTVSFHDALATGLGAGIVPVSLIFEF